jgi:hypothetical protein
MSKMSKMSKGSKKKSENARGNAASVRKQSVHKTTGDTKQHLLSKIRHLIAEPNFMIIPTFYHDMMSNLKKYDF